VIAPTPIPVRGEEGLGVCTAEALDLRKNPQDLIQVVYRRIFESLSKSQITKNTRPE
jgi:hypothetical protein